jgi:hypothetical protein
LIGTKTGPLALLRTLALGVWYALAFEHGPGAYADVC